MTAWLVVLGAGAGSFLFRLSIVALIDHISAPVALERLATFVVPAAFAGLAAAALAHPLADGGADGVSLGAAVLVTAVAAVRGRTVPIAFLGGLLTLWTATAALSIGA
jgi:branched-subunit amino acid transport protein